MKERIKTIKERVVAGLSIAFFATEWCVFARRKGGEIEVGAHMKADMLKEIYDALDELEGKEQPEAWE